MASVCELYLAIQLELSVGNCRAGGGIGKVCVAFHAHVLCTESDVGIQDLLVPPARSALDCQKKEAGRPGVLGIEYYERAELCAGSRMATWFWWHVPSLRFVRSIAD